MSVPTIQTLDHETYRRYFEPDPESHAAFADRLTTKRTAGYQPETEDRQP